ncbi:thiamine-phosphate kinase [Actinotalea sp. Marseille-Q4924]|uniref:thiamine-phosphate kinase n=1 Tax=Actinotalea sp. Marseille-Q4924 TaxID=2866571 RepID=UPI001CE457D2|nr:thiamine-phosphate kinase [Actinotalea sp. Marseille-Q4924]
MTGPSRAPRPPAGRPGPTVADLGEDALLAQVFPLLGAGAATLVGPGDDAAVVAAPDARFVVSTDLLVEGRHFRREWSEGEHVGRRAAVQNLADVAAMGARPTSLVVGLVVPSDTPVEWVLGLARGLETACAPLGVGVVGGDLSGGTELVVAVTVHGDLEGRPPVLRSGARSGDVVAHAGVLGRSAAGYAVLAAGRSDDGAPPEVSDAVARYRCPVSPLAAGPAAARAGATAMMDVSDGLLRDAGRLARASAVRVDLDDPASLAPDLDAVMPVAAVLGPGAAPADPLDWVLTGGEDHGLLATFPPGTALPEPFRRIGVVLPAEGDGPRVLVAGRPPEVRSVGWDHFRG